MDILSQFHADWEKTEKRLKKDFLMPDFLMNLQHKGIQVTLGTIGILAEGYLQKDICRRISAEGHWQKGIGRRVLQKGIAEGYWQKNFCAFLDSSQGGGFSL